MSSFEPAPSALPRRATALSIVVLALALKACNSGAAASEALPFDSARAWAHLRHLVEDIGPRYAGSEGLERTRSYLMTELSAYGLQPLREEFTAQTPKGPIPMANVYADLAARDPAAPMVVLCTHFDTKIMPFHFVGANDGGSGTAVLLELARVLAKGGPRDVTYRFLFLDGEESIAPEWVDPDNTYGSRHHTQELRRTGKHRNVKACVLLDMVGDKHLRLSTDVYSDREILNLFFNAARENGLGAHVGGPREIIYDDHLRFLEIGIPAVNLIDFEYGPPGGPLRAWWHTAEDTLDKCSAESLDAIGRIVLLGLPALERWVAKR